MKPLDPFYLITIFLLFVRIGGVFVTAPFFSHPSIPIRVRVLFTVLMAFALAGIVPGQVPPTVVHPAGLALAVGIEALTGVLLGFAARLVFFMVQYATDLLGFEMGLGMAQVYNPVDGSQVNPLGTLLMLTFLLYFLLLDGHHAVLEAVVASFYVVPLAGAQLELGGPLLLGWMVRFFTTALRMAAPFMVTFFLIQAVLGVFARIAPQTNIFSIAFPIKLLVGLAIMGLFLQNLVPTFPGLYDRLTNDVYAMIEAIAPRG